MLCDFCDLVELVKGQNVYIQMHDFPDPDAIASACGLQALLSWKGIDSKVVYYGNIDKINTKTIVELLDIQLLKVDDIAEECSESNYVITVDGQKGNSNFTDLPGEEVACVDHHPWTSNYTYRFLKHRITGACSSIITKWIMEEHMPITPQLATLLLYGIKMDTRNFMTGVTDLEIEAFSFLNDYADLNMIYELDNSVLELSDLRSYSAAIDNISIIDELGFSYIPFECPDGLIASVAEFILSLSSVKVSVVYSERKNGWKLSVRSVLDDIHCGKLTEQALEGIGSGGGHASMSGGFIPNDSSLFQNDGNTARLELRERFFHVYKKFKDASGKE